MTPKEVMELAKKNKAVMVDLKFMDFPGLWQHFSVPIKELTQDMFENGLGFDGSSIRGWQAIHMSDMLVIPDPTTAIMDPVTQHPTVSMICTIVDPITKEQYSRDPRYRCAESGSLHEITEDRRYGLLRPRGGILYLRRCAVRLHLKQRISLCRFRRGDMELGQRRRAEPRIQAET